MIGSAFSSHQLSAALQVGRMIDLRGSDLAATRRSYGLAATQGQFPVTDLAAAEGLLLSAGLVEIRDSQMHLSSRLLLLLQLEGGAAAELLAHYLSQKTSSPDDADRRAVIGAAGEELVVQACRRDLQQMGGLALLSAVQRVSLISDNFGYDVVAPTLDRRIRRLEIKSSSRPVVSSVRFYLSRNEFDAGRRHPHEWALVTCTVGADAAGGTVVGWCRAEALIPYLPSDVNGRWTEAFVVLPVGALNAGLPSSI